MKEIVLFEKKSFIGLIKATVKFSFQSFLIYSKAFVCFVLPLVCTSFFIAAFVLNRYKFIESQFHAIQTRDMFLSPVFTGMIVIYIIFFVLFIVVAALRDTLIYQYFLLYEMKEIPGTIKLRDLWQGFWSIFFTTLISFLFYTGIVLGYVLFSYRFIILLSRIGSMIVGFVDISIVLFFFYFLFATSSFFIVRVREKLNPLEALIRSFNLVQGNWWKTFGLIFLVMLLVFIIQTICITPLSYTGSTWKIPYSPSQYFDIAGISIAVGSYLSGFTVFAVCINYYSMLGIAETSSDQVKE